MHVQPVSPEPLPTGTLADPDRDIVARVLAGERGAFDELVRKYEPPIARLVSHYVRNPDDAKDVTQKAFMKAYQALPSFRHESKFQTWLYRIAVSRALDHVRSVPPGRLVEVEDDMLFTNSLGTEKLVAAEIWKKVQAHLVHLPPKQRLVLELRVFHDLSFDEIGALVDSSEDAAKVNYHHAVKRLRNVLPGGTP
jgi:RNA polymerase sigma-70 factor, ECF subfamily